MNTINEPVWTADNQNRREGDTTLSSCGWCKYRGSGSYRYDCMVTGGCNLLKSYKSDVEWNTPCKIKVLGKLDLLNIIESKKYEILEHERGIERTQKQIETLLELSENCPDKPPLPDARGADYFPIKSRVWVFIKADGEKVLETGWYAGTVVNGYRSGDGCVSYSLDELPASNGGWGCGLSVPVVLRDKEYKYFKSNPVHFAEWLIASDKNYNGEKLICEEMTKI